MCEMSQAFLSHPPLILMCRRTSRSLSRFYRKARSFSSLDSLRDLYDARHLGKTKRPGDHYHHHQQQQDDDEEEEEQEHGEVAIDIESDPLVLQIHGYSTSPSPLSSPSKQQQCTIPPVADLDFSVVLLS